MEILVALILLAVLALDILGGLVGRWVRSAALRQANNNNNPSRFGGSGS